MPLSSNSVIHYTKNIENLSNILRRGIRVNYCLEKVKTENKSIINAAFPMISFCDIPLSQIKNHIASYGNYAIGLHKSWANRNGLNPVIYVEKDSRLAKRLNEQFTRIEQLIDGGGYGDFDEWIRDFIFFASYVKNYEGTINISGKPIDNYRFYDEREWRFVVPMESLDNSMILHGEKEYLENKKSINSKVSNIFLTFDCSDITYIIVESDEDIQEIINVLNHNFQTKCSSLQLDKIYTKIITVDQIINDF